MTSIWSGEEGWCYFTAVVDCYDRSILGWSFTRRCRSTDVSPSLEQAWSATWPFTPAIPATVVCRHDNGTQFTATHYRDVAHQLGITLSRTRYRHPDGNAFVERLYRSLKEEAVWPEDFRDWRGGGTALVSAWRTSRP